MKQRTLSLSALLITGYWLLVTNVANAGILPCNPIGNPPVECKIEHIGQLLVSIYNFLLGLAAFVAVLFIIIAAIKMLIAFIGEQPESDFADAVLTLRRAVWGLVIILVAFLAVNVVIQMLGGGGLNEQLQKSGLFGPAGP